METLAATARNLRLEINPETGETIPVAELVLITLSPNYDFVDGKLYKQFTTNLHYINVDLNNLNALIERLNSVKAELESCTVDIDMNEVNNEPD